MMSGSGCGIEVQLANEVPLFFKIFSISIRAASFFSSSDKQRSACVTRLGKSLSGVLVIESTQSDSNK